MSELDFSKLPRDRRITKHLKAMMESGADMEKFAAALRAVRHDGTLTEPMREAIYKTLAQESMLAYSSVVSGQPPDFEALLAETDGSGAVEVE